MVCLYLHPQAFCATQVTTLPGQQTGQLSIFHQPLGLVYNFLIICFNINQTSQYFFVESKIVAACIDIFMSEVVLCSKIETIKGVKTSEKFITITLFYMSCKSMSDY